MQHLNSNCRERDVVNENVNLFTIPKTIHIRLTERNGAFTEKSTIIVIAVNLEVPRVLSIHANFGQVENISYGFFALSIQGSIK